MGRVKKKRGPGRYTKVAVPLTTDDEPEEYPWDDDDWEEFSPTCVCGCGEDVTDYGDTSEPCLWRQAGA